MNRENIQIVRDVIAAAPAKKFGMEDWVTTFRATPGEVLHDCGTAACIAGWAFAIAKADSESSIGVLTEDYELEEIAGDFLGLSGDEANRLFVPTWPGLQLRNLTRPHAVRVLDHLLATGEVDWKSTRSAKKAVA